MKATLEPRIVATSVQRFARDEHTDVGAGAAAITARSHGVVNATDMTRARRYSRRSAGCTASGGWRVEPVGNDDFAAAEETRVERERTRTDERDRERGR